MDFIKLSALLGASIIVKGVLFLSTINEDNQVLFPACTDSIGLPALITILCSPWYSSSSIFKLSVSLAPSTNEIVLPNIKSATLIIFDNFPFLVFAFIYCLSLKLYNCIFPSVDINASSLMSLLFIMLVIPDKISHSVLLIVVSAFLFHPLDNAVVSPDEE